MKLIVDETQLKIIPGVYEIMMSGYITGWNNPTWCLNKNLELGILAMDTLKSLIFPIVEQFQDKEIKSNYSGSVIATMYNETRSDVKAEYEMYFLFGKLMHIKGKVKNDGIIAEVEFPPLFEYIYDADIIGGVKK